MFSVYLWKQSEYVCFPHNHYKSIPLTECKFQTYASVIEMSFTGYEDLKSKLIKPDTGYVVDCASFLPCLTSGNFVTEITTLLKERRCALILKFDYLGLRSATEVRALLGLYGASLTCSGESGGSTGMAASIDSESGDLTLMAVDRLNITMRPMIHNKGDSMDVPIDAKGVVLLRVDKSPISRLMSEIVADAREIRRSKDREASASHVVIARKNNFSFILGELERKGYKRESTSETLCLVTLKRIIAKHKYQKIFLFSEKSDYLVRFDNRKIQSAHVIVEDPTLIYFQGLVDNVIVQPTTEICVYVHRGRRREYAKRSKELLSIVDALNGYINAIKANIFSIKNTEIALKEVLDIPKGVYDNTAFTSNTSPVVNTFEDTGPVSCCGHTINVDKGGRLRIDGKLSSSYRKPEFMKIAAALGLDNTGTVKVIVARITEHISRE